MRVRTSLIRQVRSVGRGVPLSHQAKFSSFHRPKGQNHVVDVLGNILYLAEVKKYMHEMYDLFPPLARENLEFFTHNVICILV